MRSNNLVSGVALDAVRPRIPTNNIALGIEHKDRIILHLLDQQAKPFLTFSHGLLGLPIASQQLFKLSQMTAEQRQPAIERVIDFSFHDDPRWYLARTGSLVAALHKARSRPITGQ